MDSPHVLVIQYPMVGHMTPVVQLCRVLVASTGCRITMVCSDAVMTPLHRLLWENYEQHVTVLPMSDGIPRQLPNWDTGRQVELQGIHELLPRSFAQYMDRFRSDRQLVCVISDLYMSWAQDVADELGVPRVAVWVSSPAEFQVYNHAKKLLKAGKLPFKAPPGRGEDDIDNMLPGILGRPPIYHRVDGICANVEQIAIDGLSTALNRRDFPSFLQVEDVSDVFFFTFIEHVKTASQVALLLFNTFEALDGPLLDLLRLQGIPACAIGPLFMLENKVIHEQKLLGGNGHSCNVEGEKRQEYPECLQWLDGQKPKGVMYVAFGTALELSLAQVKEIAKGLLNSGQPFIWAYAKPGGEGSETKKEFIKGFMEQCKGKGLVLEWAPQKMILDHPSTGAFLSHCGWNSTMETICYGVPVLCLPFVSDQFLHCKLIVEQWKVGLRLPTCGHESLALAQDISQLTQELILGERGEQIRKRVQGLKETAKTTTQWKSASHKALDSIIKLVTNVKA